MARVNYSWMLYVIFALLLVVLLLIYIYVQFDCINDKKCRHMNDLRSSLRDETYDRVRNLTTIERWPFALIVALLASIPILYLTRRNRFQWTEVLLIIGILFIGVYFSLSWMSTHFYLPNGRIIEKNLLLLSE